MPPPPAIEAGTEEPDTYGPLVPHGCTPLRIAEFPNAVPSPFGQRGIEQAPE